METIFARHALTNRGWQDQVRMTVVDGRIASIAAGSEPGAGDYQCGIVIPGLSNAHSHAFQRALAGHTEHRGPDGRDTFWTWRTQMYALASVVDAERLHAIARQLYTEMVATGFTSVAEFHYLHNEPGNHQPSTAMFEALKSAARDSGIRLCYVPVLYERGGFKNEAPSKDQLRFVRQLDEFIAHYEQAQAHSSDLSTGIGVHSLRAVTPSSLQTVAEVAASDGVPMHIHIAEQQKEVDECVDVLGARPVEWLLDNCDVDERWCLVHATHVDDIELRKICASKAVVALCPSTEANLGDGLFPLQRFIADGGRLAIGSDSHITVNPFEELRWLEYGQRLVTQSRNVAAVRRAETGRSLFELAAAGGAQTCGFGGGSLAADAPADLVVLDDDSAVLAGHTTRSVLEALVFSGFTLPIDRVMVAGTWRVSDGLHVDADQARAAYLRAVDSIRAELDA